MLAASAMVARTYRDFAPMIGNGRTMSATNVRGIRKLTTINIVENMVKRHWKHVAPAVAVSRPKRRMAKTSGYLVPSF